MGSQHAQFEQELLSGAQADVVLHRPVRSEAFEVQLSTITLDRLGPRCGIYWKHGVRLTWVFVADRLRRTRWVADWLDCRQAGGLKLLALSCDPRQGRGAGLWEAANRQDVEWALHCACEKLASSTSHAAGDGWLDSLALGRRLLSVISLDFCDLR